MHALTNGLGAAALPLSRGAPAPRCRAAATARRVVARPRASATATSSDSATGGTTISAEELDRDATAGNPLIGITPDRVPMVKAAADGSSPTAGSFNWTKQWYPVAVIDLIDATKPHPTQLLGVDLVVWRDGDGRWTAFEDKCPHRLAPLSEGRVEDDGTLLCAYHAWRFDADGKCADMPQASSREEEERVKSNPRSCAFARPTMEAQGLVWAWGEGGKEAEIEARMTPPLLVPEIEGVGKNGEAPGGAYRNHWQVRDMPYGWAAFFENAIDPAHAVVSHHTLVGSRYDDPAGFKCVVERPMTAEAGFRCALDPAVPPFNTIGKYDAETSYDFQPPCLLKIDWRHEQARFLTSHYCVPTRPGWCRHFVATVCQRGEGESVRQHRWFKLNLFTLTSPAWMTHVLGPTFLHQDMVLLHQQEKIIANGDGQALAEKWKDQVFIPTGADKMTVMFYQWFGKHGPVPWEGQNAEMPPIERDHSKLFDTWEMHTKYCTHCQGALRNTEILKNVALVAGGAKAVWFACLCAFAASAAGAAGGDASVVDVFGNLPSSAGGELFSALSLFGTAYGLHGFAGMFRSYPFSHAEEDIVMEGTAKIGLANDGPSPYIDFVDDSLFGGADKRGKPHAGGCECSGCSPHFQGIRSGVLAARKEKQAKKEAEAGAPAR
jgi:phenylpropionate dioxygenase-like ring-hydroxylating dioxygenase large terminal subunit